MVLGLVAFVCVACLLFGFGLGLHVARFRRFAWSCLSGVVNCCVCLSGGVFVG